MTDVPRAVRERLESLPHVVGTAIGKKRVDGRRTDETCLIVFVDQKIPETQLADHDRIPRTVDVGDECLATDVQQVGDVTAQTVVDPVDRQSGRTRRHRPAPPGVSIAHPAVSAGTLGSPPLETDDGETVVLTNAHVAAPIGQATAGDPILQPGPEDGGEPPEEWRSSSEAGSDGDEVDSVADTIGTLSEWSEIGPNGPNTTDSALVDVDPDDVKRTILGVGPLVGFTDTDIEADEEYIKSGRTTGVTTGDLRGRDARIRVGGFGPEPVVFEGVDLFGPMSARGDSGSLIGIDDPDNGGFTATNLLFAGSDEATIGVPMASIEGEHGTLTPLGDADGDETGDGKQPIGFHDRVRDRLEAEYDAVEEVDRAFRTRTWPLDLVVIATEDPATGVERARGIDADVVALLVPTGSETEPPEIPSGIVVVPVDP